MSINKYSPDDLSYLAKRLKKLEDEVKALKLEKKVHFTSIKDGALRILDASSNEVARFGKDNSNYGIWIREGLLRVEDDSEVIRALFGKISAGIYGVRINDASGNLLINLYDPADYRIKAPVKIDPAWDGGWKWSGASGTYITRDHNLGYFPSSAQMWGGNAFPPTQIYDESFYASMDIHWISTTQVKLYFLDNAAHGLPAVYRIVLFR